MTHQHERSLEPIVDLELIENIRQVGFDRFLADKNFLADLLVGQTFGDESQNFHLSLGERLDALIDVRRQFARYGLALYDLLKRLPRRNFPIDPIAAAMYHLDRLQKGC